jgi:tRNA (cmo5U34)-methyltransferase
MTDFRKTNWANPEFGGNYLDKADIYITERRKMFGIVRSFCLHCAASMPAPLLAADLGCGDGALAHALLQLGIPMRATLVDGAEEMLNKARTRLGGFTDVSFARATFQEILEGTVSMPAELDFVCSSMAIHHLDTREKKAFFGKIFGMLKPSGAFVNVEVVRPPSDSLDAWYMDLWEQWMKEQMDLRGMRDEEPVEVIKRYKNLEENKPDTLEMQIETLKTVGFSDVDCFYKYGIFTVYGGRRSLKTP